MREGRGTPSGNQLNLTWICDTGADIPAGGDVEEELAYQEDLECELSTQSQIEKTPSRYLRNRLLVLEELIGGDHGYTVPWADLMAEGAADAAGEIDGADLEDVFVARAGDQRDTIDGADGHAGFAAGAHVFVEEGKDLRQLLLSHDILIIGGRSGRL